MPGINNWISKESGGRHSGIIVRDLSDENHGTRVQIGVEPEHVGLRNHGHFTDRLLRMATCEAEEVRKGDAWRGIYGMESEEPEATIFHVVCKRAHARLADAKLQDLYTSIGVSNPDERLSDCLSKILFMLAGEWLSISSTLYSEHTWIIDPDSLVFDNTEVIGRPPS